MVTRSNPACVPARTAFTYASAGAGPVARPVLPTHLNGRFENQAGTSVSAVARGLAVVVGTAPASLRCAFAIQTTPTMMVAASTAASPAIQYTSLPVRRPGRAADCSALEPVAGLLEGGNFTSGQKIVHSGHDVLRQVS